MYKDDRIVFSLVCKETAFAYRSDLVSKDGQTFLKKNKENFRHYMFCKAPRIIFECFDSSKNKIKVKIQRNHTQFDEIFVGISEEFLGLKIHAISCLYPDIHVALADGSVICFASMFEFLCHVLVKPRNLLTLTVLYIGQTEIKDDYVRLDGHTTYGAISDELSKREPQSELFVKLFKFDTPALELKGKDFCPLDLQKCVISIAGAMPSEELVNLTEAAMIRAFSPDFNVHYKNNFPLREHTSYTHIFKTPIDEVEILIDERFRKYKFAFNGEVGNVVYAGFDLD